MRTNDQRGARGGRRRGHGPRRDIPPSLPRDRDARDHDGSWRTTMRAVGARGGSGGVSGGKSGGGGGAVGDGRRRRRRKGGRGRRRTRGGGEEKGDGDVVVVVVLVGRGGEIVVLRAQTTISRSWGSQPPRRGRWSQPHHRGRGGSAGAPWEGEGRQVGGFVLPVRDCRCARGGERDGRGAGSPRIAHPRPGNAEREGHSYCEFLDVGKEW